MYRYKRCFQWNEGLTNFRCQAIKCDDDLWPSCETKARNGACMEGAMPLK